ncbi:Hydroperoxy fatty acid reductase gpx1 [Alphaproteobacteria bacterium SO-S41]|nr:Hydroperoxy fatty acid reductase gpx1 [Alphaproteobacteria bacterium SO-S41]
MADEKSIYDFTLETLQGKPLPLKQFEGRPIIIVNTASKCGFTPQYKGLQAVWTERKEDGLVIIGIPSNDFGKQEPGGAGEIAEFCEINYGVDFPIAAKTPVSGRDAHPIIKFLGGEGGFLSKPRWNFYKYLVGRDGHLSTWFSSLTKPESASFKRAVDKIVKK